MAGMIVPEADVIFLDDIVMFDEFQLLKMAINVLLENFNRLV